MKILVANLGSTSLKWRLFDFSNSRERVLHKGGLERVTDYPGAIEDCLVELKQAGAIQSESDLAAVGFKPVLARGITGCVRLDERVLKAMADYNGLAPAHNPPCITGIKLFARRMPDVPLVGLFETAFHQFAPEAAMRYAVPDAWHAIGVRRWGFHGASHKFIAERSAELLDRPDVVQRARRLYLDGGATRINAAPLRVISCHLGGSSRWRGGMCRDVGPRNAVECPSVIEITCAVESTKHDYFAVVWIVSHRKIRVRWRRAVRRKLNPTSRVQHT